MTTRPRVSWLDEVQRQHLEAVAKEMPWATDRERLRANAPMPPGLSALTKQMPAPHPRTPS